MNPILLALMHAAAQAKQGPAQPPPMPMSPLGFQSPFMPQAAPINFSSGPMSDPQGDAFKQEQEAAKKAQLIETIRQQIAQTRTQMATAATKPVAHKKALSKNEALIGAGISALASLLGARPQFLQPAIQQFIGTKQGMADQQFEEDSAGRDHAAAILQAQLANQTDQLTDAQRAQMREQDLGDQRAKMAFEKDATGDKQKATFDQKLLTMMQYVPAEYRPYLGAQLGLPAPGVLGVPTAKEENLGANTDLAKEKTKEIEAFRTERGKKIKADRILAETRTKAVLVGMGLTEAQTQKVLKDVSWADAEYASKIAARKAMAEAAGERIRVTMRGQDMAGQRAAEKELNKANAGILSAAKAQLKKIEAERKDLNARHQRQLEDGEDEWAAQTEKELTLNAARANRAAEEIFRIEQEQRQAGTASQADSGFSPGIPGGTVAEGAGALPQTDAARKLGEKLGQMGGSAVRGSIGNGKAPARKPASKKPAAKKASGKTRSGVPWEYTPGG